MDWCFFTRLKISQSRSIDSQSKFLPEAWTQAVRNADTALSESTLQKFLLAPYAIYFQERHEDLIGFLIHPDPW